jgi:hypothetical protein
VLETNNQEQLIFKHAISTVVTTKAMQAAHNTHQTAAAPLAQAVGAAPQHADG